MIEQKNERGIVTTLFCCNEIRVFNITELKEIVCDECGEVLLSNMKYNGYVYILGNPSINDHIKIGYTERQIQKRIKELSSTTGVPSEFELIGYFLASKGMKSEKLVHKTLKQYRTNTSREFFKISPSNALEIIQELLQLEPEFINEERLSYYESKFKLHKPVEEVEKDNTKSIISRKENICPKCKIKMRNLKKGGYKCRKCRSIFR